MEAARIDGASEMRIFLRLILPLGLPAIASLAIFQFLWTWNDLLVALTFARDTQPITVAIFSQLRQFGSNIELIAPASFVSLAIPLAVFFAFQRYFVQGLLAGSVKVGRVTARVAIVGSGLGGFVAYATLRHGGLEPGEIAVLRGDADPAAAWRPRAAAIRQRSMRSESDGHCWPTTFPGLAAREAVRRRDLAPLVLSVCDRYRPSVAEFLRHVDEVRARSRWDESFRRGRIESVRAVDGGFELDRHGTFRHVLLAPGHPGLAVPPELERDPRAVHAYEPHEYAARVAVVGAGMAAATEWLNALAAGAEVVSVRRREPARRPLNVARPLFTKRGLAGFHATAPAERAELLRRFGEPSYPPGRAWDAPVRARGARGPLPRRGR